MRPFAHSFAESVTFLCAHCIKYVVEHTSAHTQRMDLTVKSETSCVQQFNLRN